MLLKKVNRLISVTLLAILQAVFLFMIFRENRQVNLINITVILLSLLILVAHFRAPLHHEDHLYESVLVALWLPPGALLSYYLNHNLGLGPILGAAMVGTLASFLPLLKKSSSYLKHLPPVIYCGAFIGMSSLKVANGFFFVLLASVFAGIGLVLSKSLFLGMGGKLGLLAFSGVVLASLFLFLMNVYAI